MICRRPHAALRPFVDLVWSTEGDCSITDGAQELSLPGGSHHIVIRTGAPLRIFRSAHDKVGEDVGVAILGGMRLAPVRKTVDGRASVGAVLRPDALGLVRARAPFEFAGRHTVLTDVWPSGEVADSVGQIRETATSAERMVQFERLLLRLFSGALGPDPLVRHALRRLDQGGKINAVVSETGLSHRHFCARFKEAVGILPVEYRQVRRFDRLIAALSRPGRDRLAEVAFSAGYSDQPHMAREFRAFSGLSLREYEKLAPAQPRHIQLPT